MPFVPFAATVGMWLGGSAALGGAAIVTTAASIGATVGTSIYGAAQQASQQKELIAHQESQVRAAEAKVAGAEALAEEKAATEIKRKRAAMTQTILTSPLGIQEEANVGMSRLLGGR